MYPCKLSIPLLLKLTVVLKTTNVFILFLALRIVLSVWAPCPQGLAAPTDSQFLCWAAFRSPPTEEGTAPEVAIARDTVCWFDQQMYQECSELGLPRRCGRGSSWWRDNWRQPLCGMMYPTLLFPAVLSHVDICCREHLWFQDFDGWLTLRYFPFSCRRETHSWIKECWDEVRHASSPSRYRIRTGLKPACATEWAPGYPGPCSEADSDDNQPQRRMWEVWGKAPAWVLAEQGRFTWTEGAYIWAHTNEWPCIWILDASATEKK